MIKRNIPDFNSLIWTFIDELTNLPENKNVVACRLKNTVYAKPRVENQDGSPVTEEQIIYFIRQETPWELLIYLNEKQEIVFDEQILRKVYSDIEYYRRTHKIHFNVLCPMISFKCDLDEIKLNSDFTIRRISEAEWNYLGEGDVYSAYILSYLAKYAIYYKYSIFAEIDDSKKKQKIIRKIQNLLRAFRLYKEGDLYIDSIRQKPEGYAAVYLPYLLSVKNPKPVERPYNFNEMDVDDFHVFYQRYTTSKSLKRLSVALNRFDFYYERGRCEDELIDLMIAFESLFSNKKAYDKGELIGTACSMLIGTNYVDRDRISKIINEAYDLRNSIIHGDDYNKERVKAIIKSLDPILRDSIKKLL